jgi:FlaA1/EpsC-like NDP-sugar epimerase
MKKILNLIGRSDTLFDTDINNFKVDIDLLIKRSKFLVIGAAGSIGKSVIFEIFKRNPLALHAVDISENNLVELVRSLRSSLGYIHGDFRTFAIDSSSSEFKCFVSNETVNYDYVFNLSALKHVRSESDPYTLMRMIRVNIFNTMDILDLIKPHTNLKKYFCVSTDKAANPVNLMGASKLVMELFLMRASLDVNISSARFANVAFSDGSLLHGFNQRYLNNEPITAPVDIKRYFITPEESGQLCLLSALFGENRDIFFPKIENGLDLIKLSDIAQRFIAEKGFEPFICDSEEEARAKAKELIPSKKWPCYFFKSDTTGEKDFEEFFTQKETIDMDKFKDVGIIKKEPNFNSEKLNMFSSGINHLISHNQWNKEDIVKLFNNILDNFYHKETGKYLDQKM